jgi:hypothetical protein
MYPPLPVFLQEMQSNQAVESFRYPWQSLAENTFLSFSVSFGSILQHILVLLLIFSFYDGSAFVSRKRYYFEGLRKRVEITKGFLPQ